MGECGSTIPDWFQWKLTGHGKKSYASVGHACVPPSDSWRARFCQLTWVVLLLFQLILSGCEQEQPTAVKSERAIETASSSVAMRLDGRDALRVSAPGSKSVSAQSMEQIGDASSDRIRRQLDQHIQRLESLVSGLFLMVSSPDGKKYMGFTIKQVRRVDNRLVFRQSPPPQGSAADDLQAVVAPSGSANAAVMDLRWLEETAVQLIESGGVGLLQKGVVLQLNLPFNAILDEDSARQLGVATVYTAPSVRFGCPEKFPGNCRIAAEVLVRMIEPVRAIFGSLSRERSMPVPSQSSESQPPGIGIIGRWQHTPPAFPVGVTASWVIEFNEDGTYCFLDQSNGAAHQGRFVAGASKWSLSGTWSSHLQLPVGTPFEDSGTYHRLPDNKLAINGRYAKTIWESMGSLDGAFAKSVCENAVRALRNR